MGFTGVCPDLSWLYFGWQDWQLLKSDYTLRSFYGVLGLRLPFGKGALFDEIQSSLHREKGGELDVSATACLQVAARLTSLSIPRVFDSIGTGGKIYRRSLCSRVSSWSHDYRRIWRQRRRAWLRLGSLAFIQAVGVWVRVDWVHKTGTWAGLMHLGSTLKTHYWTKTHSHFAGCLFSNTSESDLWSGK